MNRGPTIITHVDTAQVLRWWGRFKVAILGTQG
jgi:hypothetical protein